MKRVSCLLIMSPCVTLDYAQKKIGRLLYGVDVGTVLNFSQVSSNEIKKILPHCKIIPTSERLTQISKWFNRHYASFLSSLPQKLKEVVPGLLELATYNAPSSVWAVSNLAEKNNKVYFGFQYACIGKLFADEVKVIEGKKVLIFASKLSSYQFFNKLCTSHNIEVIPTGRKFVKKGERLIKWSKLVYRRLRTLLRFIIVKYHLTKINESQKEHPDILFYTQYSRTWVREYGNFYDRFLKRLPHAVKEKSGKTPGYLINISGTHFIRPVRDVIKDIRTLSSRNDLQGMSFFLLESSMKFIEGLKLFLSFKYIFIFRRMLNFKCRQALFFNGIDISNVIEDEIFASMMALPNNILYISAIKRLLKMMSIKILIHPFFEYSWGKAVMYGIEDAETGCKSIAIQHGSCASNLLLAINDPKDFVNRGNGINLPLASAYYIDGEIFKNILGRSGYPEERLFTFGAPRFDRLRYSYTKTAEYPVEKEIAKKKDEGKRVLCLLPVTTDTEEYIRFMEEAISEEKREFFFFMLKLHPNVVHKYQGEIELIHKFFSTCDVLITDIPTYDLMSISDIIVTHFSTTGIEALALGKRVICLCMPGKLNMSPLVDDVDFVPTVYEPNDFTRSLDHLSGNRDVMIKYAGKQLFSLDGKAADRIAEHVLTNYI